ncbi:prepilin-type N-terminal cleavage/methylation domain-containing protein [Deinococcus radiotolerans]|uniref:Prepilin-type N-terminal cleavage/methylation domain-containing protein n=1 Tax=Deinococcus radiotolerans TaxID=1309407 RepID=A0ABQ2FID4_9DEIO|nr:prepilin-type N-terminal cleavage/methylation domain-containing protein [Deinococcus radiotolerans]GGL01383.1 hypothetical protein GCM10010844_19780 [Deinococcus radiotolerans]
MSRPTPASPASVQGFTLLELLIAAALALVILGAAGALLSTTARIQSIEQERVPLQETVRSSVEVIAQDLRQATGNRVLYSGANLPADLLTNLSTSQQLTVTIADNNGYFTIPQPGGYPNSKSFSQNAVTSLNTPNAAGQTCDNQFVGNDWAMVTVGNAVRWIRTHPTNPCTGSGGGGNVKLQHRGYTLDDLAWTPDSAIIKVNVVRYYIGTALLNGASVPTLYRSVDAQDPQIVAYYITALALAYSQDGVNFVSTPTGAPQAVRVTLTGRETRARKAGAQPETFTVTSTVSMRRVNFNATP